MQGISLFLALETVIYRLEWQAKTKKICKVILLYRCAINRQKCIGMCVFDGGDESELTKGKIASNRKSHQCKV